MNMNKTQKIEKVMGESRRPLRKLVTCMIQGMSSSSSSRIRDCARVLNFAGWHITLGLTNKIRKGFQAIPKTSLRGTTANKRSHVDVPMLHSQHVSTPTSLKRCTE